MNIFVNRENSGWIIDRIANDFAHFTRHTIVRPEKAQVCWLPNFWGYRRLASLMKKIPSFLEIHHVPEHKLDKYDFEFCDKFVSGYIVPNKKTEEFITKHVSVPVYRFPYWVPSDSMISHNDCVDLKKELSPNGEILIGSFQKDSEGKTLNPKLEKGPDTFIDIVRQLKTHNIKVVLTGYHRQYVIKELNKYKIPFVFYEKASITQLCNLYDCLDWYFVTSRSEGGPQAILEASYRKVKILSTDVGIAPEVLHKDCICNSVIDFVEKMYNCIDRRNENFKNAQEYLPQKIIPLMDDFFENQVKRK